MGLKEKKELAAKERHRQTEKKRRIEENTVFENISNLCNGTSLYGEMIHRFSFHS